MRELFSAYWSFTRNLEKRLKNYGLNTGNPKVFLYLKDNEGCQQSDMAKRCYVESATLSTVLVNMEKNGLIMREQTADNKRSYSIYLTDKGHEVSGIVDKQFDAIYDAAFEGFSNKEIKELQAYLQRVTDNLKDL